MTKLQPDRRVVAWIALNFSRLYLATPVLAELGYGCEKLVLSAKRRELECWLSDLTAQLARRILPFDQHAAEVHGKMRARMIKIGKTWSPSDSYIAAMALSLDCPIVTRNIGHFEWTGVTLIDPWKL